jgi:hypothetical protein
MLAPCTALWLLTIAQPPSTSTIIVNAASSVELRAEWRAASIRLRTHAQSRHVGYGADVETLRILELDHSRPRFTLDLSPVERAYASFDYRGAETLLARALAEVLSHARGIELRRSVREISVWRAVVQTAEDRSQDAERSFRLALALKPGLQLDAAIYPPPVLHALEEARKPSAQLGSLKLAVEPRDAVVEIDGAPAPSGEIPAGEHLLTVTHPGRAWLVQLIEIREAQVTALDVQLKAEPTLEATRRLTERIRAAKDTAARVAAAASLGSHLGGRRVVLLEAIDSRRARLRAVEAESEDTMKPLAFDGTITGEVTRLIEQAQLGDGVTSQAAGDWYEQWWLWAALGVVAAGGVTAGVLWTADDPSRRFNCCGP